MKLVAPVKLLPSPEQAVALLGTLARCNEACDWLAEAGLAAGKTRQYDLHRLAYAELRSRFGLTAQAAIRCIAKVADAFKVNREVAPRFRRDAAQPYDERILRFAADDTANLWTIAGRLEDLLRGEREAARPARTPQGRGRPGPHPGQVVPDLHLRHSGARVLRPGGLARRGPRDPQPRRGQRRRGVQRRRGPAGAARLRPPPAQPAAEGDEAARRKLRGLKGKQARFQADTNHRVSKAIVAKAERSRRGIALEDFRGIRGRVKARRRQRAMMANWAFRQLATFVVYKAALAGVPVVLVDPRNTSRECPACGHVEKANRRDRDTFRCRSCDFAGEADTIAAVNIRSRARAAP